MDINTLRDMGLNLRNSGNLEDAIIAFNRLKTRYPEDQRVYVDLGICYRQSKDFHSSQAILNELLKKESLQKNWKSLAENQLFHIERALITECCQRPITEDFYDYKQSWLDTVHKNEDVTLRNIGYVWETNFLCAKCVGAASIFAESFLLMIKHLPANESKNLTPAIGSIASYFINIGELERAKFLTSLLPHDSHLYIRLMVNLGRENNNYSDCLRVGVTHAQNSKSVHLLAHSNMALLSHSLMSFHIEEAHQYIAAISDFFENQSESKAPPFHLLKAKYLSEMELCKGVNKLSHQSYSSKDLHITYLDLIKENKNYRQKVVISAYYLSKVFSGVYNDFELNLTSYKKHKSTMPIIPKVIIQYWDKKEIPKDVQRCMNSIKNAAINYEHLIFNRESALDFIHKNYDDEYVKLFKACSHPALQSDIFRLLYLFKNGGIWIDADEEYLSQDSAPLSSLLQKESIRFQRVQQIEIQNNFIVACKESSLLGKVIANLDFDECLEEEFIWWNTGPGAFSYCLAQMYAESQVNVDTSKANLTLKLLHNHTYNSIFRTPKLDYKETALSWQVNSTNK